MNSKFLVLGVAVIAVCAAAGWWFMTAQNTAPSTPNATQAELGEPAVTIVRTAEGYEPKEVSIKKGDIVMWVNESGEFHWPASDLHPTHGVYPEFDPLRPIAVDETWKFKFDKEGVWKYHDHIRANKTGTITVTN
jgi:plastocyanin